MAKSVRRITADKKERIGRLADILYDFLPLTASSEHAVTFQSIFRESQIDKYFQGESNKKKALMQGLEKLFRYHEKLPRIVIRKIIPAAISYRTYKRNPLSRAEFNSLSDCLKDLGIDMSGEIAKVNVDESLPLIVAPPKRLIENLQNYSLASPRLSEAICLFVDGHFNEAVRKAAEIYEVHVREVSEMKLSGRDLMANAFSGGENLNLDSIKEENMKDFMDGYKFLSMGAMAAMRNIFSHSHEEQRSPEECFEMIFFFNWLIRYLK